MLLYQRCIICREYYFQRCVEPSPCTAYLFIIRTGHIADTILQCSAVTHHFVEYLADVIVKLGVTNDFVATILGVTVDLLDNKRDAIQSHTGTQHVDNKYMRQLIDVISLEP